MRALAFVLAVLPAVLASGQTSNPVPDKYEMAERAIRRLSPDAYPALPAPVRAYLKERGYLIPQCYLDMKPHNVLRGRFLGPRQTDWAVLGSLNHRSSILVFPKGSAERVVVLAEGEDKECLQGTGGEDIGYSRLIAPVGRQYILEHFKRYGGPKPPPIDHQGIDDGFAEKGSAVLYFYKGEWLTLTGAD